MSMRLAKPNTLNLDGIFAKLNNVVWTNYGPFAVEDFTQRRLDVMAAGAQSGMPGMRADVNVLSIDKFPRMLDYVVPSGVRIGDGDRVRLGAYLSEGTTVMHAGFVNFNAGTLGTCMIEGRVSQGVVVGDGSDVGGGASIMGTLSGGGKLRNSIGEHSLLGANAGIGISLGDNCVVEAGLYVTAGTKIEVFDREKAAAGVDLDVVKGADLSGKNNILFIRNSLTGAIQELRIGHAAKRDRFERRLEFRHFVKPISLSSVPFPWEGPYEHRHRLRGQDQGTVSQRRHRRIQQTADPLRQNQHH